MTSCSCLHLLFILFDDFTYYDDDDDTEADTMMDVVYEGDSDDD